MQSPHILVPLDGSRLAEKALTHALTVYDSRVTVLNVVTPVDAPLSEGGVLEAGEERIEAAEKRTEQVIERARTDAPTPDREIETVVETGDPAETILAFADDHGIDQVVMGGHSDDHGRISRRLLGTVATTVVGDSPVTVTVVR